MNPDFTLITLTGVLIIELILIIYLQTSKNMVRDIKYRKGDQVFFIHNSVYCVGKVTDSFKSTIEPHESIVIYFIEGLGFDTYFFENELFESISDLKADLDLQFFSEHPEFEPIEQKVARDSETGQFTTLDDAKARPKETVVETIRREV
jgi:hypothetical protein